MQDFQCNDCGRKFARQEHLTRHRRSHTRERPHSCTECTKSFARLDVLQRHQASHRRLPASRAGLQPRACNQCAAQRVRCSRQKPCERCAQKQISCDYPEAAKPCRRQTGQEADGHDLTNGQSENEGMEMEMEMPRSHPDPGPDPDPNPETPELAPLPPSPSGEQVRQPQITQTFHQQGQDPYWNNIIEAGHLYDAPMEEPAGPNYQLTNLLAANWLSPSAPCIYDWAAVMQPEWGVISPNRFGIDRPVMNHPEHLGLDASSPNQFAITTNPGPVAPQIDTRGIAPSRDIVQDSPNLVLPANDQPSFSLHSVGVDQPTQSASPSDSRSTISQPPRAASYVGGLPTRLPFKGRSAQNDAEAQHLSEGSPSSEQLIDGLSPQTDHSMATASANSSTHGPNSAESISQYSYDYFKSQVMLSLGTENPADVSWFPTLFHVRLFYRCYFLHFHPAYPFLPRDSNYYGVNERWPLLLAVVSAGAQLAPKKYRQPCIHGLITALASISSRMFHRSKSLFTRSSFDFSPQPTSTIGQSSPDTDSDSLTTLQTAILGVVTALGTTEAQSSQGLDISDLAPFCKQLGYFGICEEFDDGSSPAQTVLSQRLRSRAAMMVFVLDTIESFQTSREPSLRLGDVTGTIPCSEDLWDPRTGKGLHGRSLVSVTVPKGLQMLYVEKTLPPYLDNLGTILLVCAIYRQTQEVLYYHRNSLSHWEPTADVDLSRRQNHGTVQESWPPTLPILSKWRNAACDCLDILHWNANAVVAKAGGWEHPAVMTLHLSRLVLLAPLRYLREIPALLQPGWSSGSSGHNSADLRMQELRNKLISWVFNDQYKARLSVIHAGAIFWHLRRYSTGNFLEPWAIYSASLVLWAHSKVTQLYHSQEVSPEEVENQSSTTANIPEPPPFLHLDRPLDDEMVQAYVKSGYKSAGYLLGVGDVRAPGACDKILRMGRELLANHQQQRRSQRASNSLGTSEPDITSSDPVSVESVYAGYLDQIEAQIDW